MTKSQLSLTTMNVSHQFICQILKLKVSVGILLCTITITTIIHNCSNYSCMTSDHTSERHLQSLLNRVWLSSAAFSCTIYQLNRDEMCSEAASTRSAHNLEVVLGLCPIFHSGLSSFISLLLSRRSIASLKKKKKDKQWMSMKTCKTTWQGFRQQIFVLLLSLIHSFVHKDTVDGKYYEQWEQIQWQVTKENLKNKCRCFHRGTWYSWTISIQPGSAAWIKMLIRSSLFWWQEEKIPSDLRQFMFFSFSLSSISPQWTNQNPKANKQLTMKL